MTFFRNETSIYSQSHRQPLLSLAKLRAALVGRQAAAIAQTAAPSDAPATLNAVGFNLVSQVNLGALLQVDSGRLAETKGTSAGILQLRSSDGYQPYSGTLNALNVILKKKDITPSNSLLHGAYDAMIFRLEADRHTAFD
jgi:putative membrane protein